MCPSFRLERYRQLEHRELVELQNEDERISMIKEALGSGEDVLFKKFTTRNGIVYRKFFSRINDKVILTVYVPSCIVRDVLLHSHLQELHPSGRQTYRSFSESFYHPQAQKLARQLCRSCPHCTAERGSSDKFSRVPKIKVLKPSKPREGLSLDLVLLPKTRDGYCYGLLIVDLFTLYVSF
ncbi:MAG: integrase zinc binding domain-containing protein, partial [bacterium]